MPYVVIHCKIEDYAKWKPIFDADVRNRQAGGSRGGQLFRNANDPHETVMVFEWDSLERASQFMQSPALRETMGQAGVIGQPSVSFLEKVEDLAG